MKRLPAEWMHRTGAQNVQSWKIECSSRHYRRSPEEARAQMHIRIV